MEPRVLSICWLPRGKLAAQPDRINQTGASEEGVIGILVSKTRDCMNSASRA